MDLDDDGFDERDIMELINLAAYLEGKAERGLFPKARFRRYSDVLDRLLEFTIEIIEMERSALVAGIAQRRAAALLKGALRAHPPHDPTKVLTHPRFRGPPGEKE